MSKYLPWKEFERDIVRKLKGAGLSFVRRNWSPQFSGKDPVDILAGKYVFQLKYGDKPNLKGAWEEANSADHIKGRIPIGVCRFKKERNTLVVMDWKTFENLLKTVIYDAN